MSPTLSRIVESGSTRFGTPFKTGRRLVANDLDTRNLVFDLGN